MDRKRIRTGTLVIYIVVFVTLVTGLVLAINAARQSKEINGSLKEPVVADVSMETNDQPENMLSIGVPEESEVVSEMAGNWRSQRHDGYTANDTIISLFADGTWEWSGPLATDSVDGGSFTIERLEDGTYNLSFLIEHTNSPYTEIGLEIEGVLQYDPQNDHMSTQDESTEVPGNFMTVPYIRVPHSARDEAPTWNEDGLTNSVSNTPEGREYRFDSLGFSFTLPDSWDEYYELRGSDEFGIQVYFDAMGVFADLFMIAVFDTFHTEILEIGQIEEIRRFEVGTTEFIMYKSGFRSLVLETEDYSSHFWDLDDEMNQHIRETLSRMYIESDTIVADSIRILTP